MLTRLKIDTNIPKLAGQKSSLLSASSKGAELGVIGLRNRSVSDASSISSAEEFSSPLTSSSNASTSSLQIPHERVGSSPTLSPSIPIFDEAVRTGVDYVVALHDYEPQNESATCLSFRAGQIIRVYNRDNSGWWDGELDGQRGWFPSNFVSSQSASLTEEELPRPSKSLRQAHAMSVASVTSWTGSLATTGDSVTYEEEESLIEPSESEPDSYCHPLLVPLLHAMSLLHSAIRAERRSHYCPSTACVISCVRSVLSATDSLQRDAPILSRYPILAQERKETLETLAYLVGQAKAASMDNITEHAHQMGTEGMLQFSRKIFECLRHFLTTAVQCGVELPERRLSGEPSRSEVVSTSSSFQNQQTILSRHKRLSSEVPIPSAPPIAYSMTESQATAPVVDVRPLRVPIRTKSMSNIRQSSISDDDHESAMPLLAHRTIDAKSRQDQYLLNRRSSMSSRHQSTQSTSSMSSFSSIESPMPTPVPPAFPVGPTSAVQVLDALRYTHDEYLSTIAAFIGYSHSYSRQSHASSTGHMYELVREVVDRVCKLLSIVEAVLAHPEIPINKIPNLRSARDGLYNVTSTLADSVRFLNPASSSSDMTEEEERQALINSATGALRAGADCVAAVKMCMVRLASEPSGIPFRIDIPANVQASSYTSRIPAPSRPIPPSPRRSLSFGHVIHQPLAVNTDDEVTIQVQNPTPVARRTRDPSSGSDSSSGISKASTRRSEDTPLTSPEETRPVGPISIINSPVEPPLPSPSVYSQRTDDGTTWEGSVRSPLDYKILNGDLPPAPEPDVDDPSGWAFSHDYALDDVAYNSEGHLVGATLNVLVEKMTPHDSIVDPAFCAVFFMTFRLFSTPLELVDAIIARYNLEPPPSLSQDAVPYWQRQKGVPVRLRVSNFLKLWIETYWRPGTDDEALDLIHTFTSRALSPLFRKPAERILELVQVRRQTSEVVISPKGERIRDPGMLINPPVPASPSEIPRPTMTKTLLNTLRNKNFTSISITDFDALELARQLTVMECNLYCAIKPQEMLETGNVKTPSITIKAMSTLSNTITGWVTESILNEQDTKKRTNLIKFFIKVADRATGLQNYSTPRSILAALDSSTIARLRQTWASVPTKNRAQLEALRRLADHTRNYHEYRTHLRNTAPPAVPFLGLYLTDITFCREGNPSHRTSPINPNKKLLNFNKYHKLARIVQDMQRFQVPFNLKAIPEVQSYLEAVFERTRDQSESSVQALYRRSLLIEPKQPADTPPSAGDMTRQLFNWAGRSQSQATTPA